MKSCSACSRPLLPVAESCPFCGIRLSAKWVAAAGTAVVTPFLLSACYGGAWDPIECFDDDLDGDGFIGDSSCEPVPEDCDDTNFDINPGADEVCDDGVDNNCDGVLAGVDQDEICNNGLDDDCDGEVDETPDNPGSEVLCDDGLDNDCDGLIDLDDPNCRGIADGDTDPSAAGDLTVVYTFDGPELAVDCETAGLSVLSVHAEGPEPVDPFSTACDDTGVQLNALLSGTWAVELSGTSATGEYWSGVVEQIAVSSDEHLATVALDCLGADGNSPCVGRESETR